MYFVCVDAFPTNKYKSFRESVLQYYGTDIEEEERMRGQLLSFVVTVFISRAHILSHLIPSRIHSHFEFVFFRTLKILHKHRLHT